MESADNHPQEDIERKARVERLKRDLFGDLLTTAEVAEILEVHPRTVGEYIRDRKLHAIQLGGSWRVSEDSLKAFVTGLYLQGSLPEPESSAAAAKHQEAISRYERERKPEPEGRRSRRGSSGSSMFERFTDRARRVVVLAQEEARLQNHHYIGTEHLLLGLISEGEGVAFLALEQTGVTLERSRELLEEMVGRGSEGLSGHIPFTPRAKKALELTLREALQLGHNHIGTEHILLGLIREGEGVALQLLQKQGVDFASLKTLVFETMSAQYRRTAGTFVLPSSEKGEAKEDLGEGEALYSRVVAEIRPKSEGFSERALEGAYEEIRRIEESSGSKRGKKDKSPAASIYARFTQEARHVILYSQEEARLLNHGYVGTEHLLLGLLAGAEGGGVALRALNILGVSLEPTRQAIKMMIGTGSKEFVGTVPLTPRAKKVFELALREALNMKQDQIGTEHLLLALIGEGEGIAAQVLERTGLELEAVRTVVKEINRAGTHLEEKLHPAPESRATKPKTTAKLDPQAYRVVLSAKPAKSKTGPKSVKAKPAPVKRKAKTQGTKPKTKAAPKKKPRPTSRKKK